MGLNIKNPEVEARIRRFAVREGLSLTDAIDRAIRSQLGDEVELRRQEIARKMKLVEEIQERVANAPILDPRPLQVIMDEMYDENGLPV